MKRSPSIVRLDEPPALQVLDPSTAFLYTPRTLTALLIGLIALAHFAGVLHTSPPAPSHDAPPADARATRNVELGVWAAATVFLGYSALHGPRTSMHRPHPVVWRLVHGMLMLYLLGLVWLLFQDAPAARAFLRHLDSSLGVPVEYRSYAADCRLWVPGAGVNWGVLRGTLDEFVVAHAVGWWAKALCVRNYTLLWALSIMFELMEVTFRHMLPNFNECWWDSWVLDVAVCNLAGILVGMWTVRWFECKYEKYNWQGISELPTLKAKARRTLAQLLPYSWTKLDWMEFSSTRGASPSTAAAAGAGPARFLAALLVVVVMLVFELNAFFLKYALWVPPPHPLNAARLVLWFLVALPGVREWYEFVTAPGVDDGGAATGGGGGAAFRKLGVFAWLAIALTCIETMVSFKFGRGLYSAPWPAPVLWGWGIVGAGGTIALAVSQAQLWASQRASAAAAAVNAKKGS